MEAGAPMEARAPIFPVLVFVAASAWLGTSLLDHLQQSGSIAPSSPRVR